MNFKIISTLIVLSLFCVVQALDKAQCKCRINSSKRIVYGQKAPIYPWLASIALVNDKMPPGLSRTLPYSVTKNICMATILSEHFLLTSASCIPDIAALKYIGVGVGSNDMEVIEKNLMEIDKVVSHPKYERHFLTTRHDLAIIKLKTPLNFTENVQPACLDLEKTEKYEDFLKFAGFGSKEPVLMDVGTLKVLNFSPTRYLTEGRTQDFSLYAYSCVNRMSELICTDDPIFQNHICVGDIGTSLLLNKNGRSYVVGVATIPNYENVSESYKKVRLCKSGTNVARLSYYKEWIEQTVGDNYCH